MWPGVDAVMCGGMEAVRRAVHCGAYWGTVQIEAGCGSNSVEMMPCTVPDGDTGMVVINGMYGFFLLQTQGSAPVFTCGFRCILNAQTE